MTSSTGQFVIAFNGGYNTGVGTELNYSSNSMSPAGRVLLKWRGYSDTETLLAAFERWGVVAT